MKKICLSTLFFALYITQAYAARFDCATDTKPIVKLICSDPKTLELDSEMVSIFKQVVELLPESDTPGFASDSVKWQDQELYECKDKDCLISAYKPRIEVLRSTLKKYRELADKNGVPVKGYVMPPEHRIENQKLPLTFKSGFVRDAALCEGYRNMLNAAKYTEYPACERKILPQYKDFEKIEWKEVSNVDEIIKMLDLASTLDPDHFLGPDINEKNDPGYLEKRKINIVNNRSKIYFFNFDVNNDKKSDTIFKTSYISDLAEKYNLCKIKNLYFIDDSAKKNPQEYNSYAMVNAAQDVDFFFYKKELFISSWQGRGGLEELIVYTPTGRKDCVYKIQ